MKRTAFHSALTTRLPGGVRTRYRAKRGLDLALATIATIVASPLLLAIVVAIAATSRGPVFFTQQRVGGRLVRVAGEWRWEPFTFTFFKFRSMRHEGSDEAHRAYMEAFIRGDEAALAAQNPEASMYKLDRDPRVTAIGAFLRRTSLDELPQLINVFRGEMSLVGPRPALEYEVEHYAPRHMRRFQALGGITGWWQVVGRSAVSFERMIDLDIWYVEHQSLRLDLEILARTCIVLMRRDGAA